MQLYRFKCEIYWILPKLAIFTPVPTSTQDVLAITLLITTPALPPIIPHVKVLWLTKGIPWKNCSTFSQLFTVIQTSVNLGTEDFFNKINIEYQFF